MFSLSPIKLVIIIAVALIVLGPDKLPEVARQVGTLWKSAKSWQSRIESEVRDVIPDLPSTADIARIARSPVHLLNSLADKVAEPIDEDEVAAPAPSDDEAAVAAVASTPDQATSSSAAPSDEQEYVPDYVEPTRAPPIGFGDPSLN